MSVLSSFLVEVRIASPLFPPSPRSRLVKNVTDTKLVKNLAKYRRFSIGSLRKTAGGLYCFTRCFRYAVILHIFTIPCLFLFLWAMSQMTTCNHMATAARVKKPASNTLHNPYLYIYTIIVIKSYFANFISAIINVSRIMSRKANLILCKITCLLTCGSN